MDAPFKPRYTPLEIEDEDVYANRRDRAFREDTFLPISTPVVFDVAREGVYKLAMDPDVTVFRFSARVGALVEDIVVFEPTYSFLAIDTPPRVPMDPVVPEASEASVVEDIKAVDPTYSFLAIDAPPRVRSDPFVPAELVESVVLEMLRVPTTVTFVRLSQVRL